MKKNAVSLLALILAAASLVISGLCLVRLSNTEQELAFLREQLNESGDFPAVSQKASLEDFTLTADPWADNMGADVRMEARPVGSTEDLTAVFQITLRGETVLTVPCSLESGVFTASVSLKADNGYGYYLMLESPDGSADQVDLASENNLSSPLLVYLADSLTSFSSVILDDWASADGSLTLVSGLAQVRLPQLGSLEDAAPAASLVLTCEMEGEEALLSTQELTLVPGEASNSYEQELSGTVFEIPALKPGDHLTLTLELTFPDGRTESVSGAEWYSESEGLMLVAG